MGFLGVYKALYDYAPQSEGELTLVEGDLLYILEKSTEDDWWKAKKKAGPDEEDEPEGLIPSTYIDEVQPSGRARALYDYTRQSDEELSFPEDAQLAVYDTSDPDWILAGYEGDVGFAPANYIELQDSVEDGDDEPAPAPRPPALPVRAPPADSPDPSSPADATGPAAAIGASAAATALAGVLAGRSASSKTHAGAVPPLDLQRRPQYTSDGTDDEDDGKSPPLPARPRGQTMNSTDEPSPQAAQSPPLPQRTVRVQYEGDDDGDDNPRSPQPQLSPGGFRMYNINEMVSVLGKRKKMPTTLGINLKTGTILIAPERAQDGPSREWLADRMTHYSREGKHVFLELVRPSKSVDLHAGAKDTAEEIVSALGELAGAVKAEGLREVIMAATGREQKKGQVLYDFMAQGDDEVTVGVGDDVIILDDTKSEEWWQVRRVKNGKEGVVPSSYIEITGTVPAAAAAGPSTPTGVNAGRSTVSQNRLEEERLTKEAVRAAMKDEARRHSEVGPGMQLPERRSSLSARNTSSNRTGHQGHYQSQRSSGKRENGRADAPGSSSRSGKSKPDASKVRTWTDRTKSFSVEAQYLGLKDGKINLHKMNGVKIAVPIAKMSVEDLEYVERAEGISLDEDKPLSSVKRAAVANRTAAGGGGAKVGASIEQPKKPEYDWFPFFLACEVQTGLCDRYAQAFAKESMDESVLPDVDATVLRNLGLREGDIIKVMRHLDARFGRNRRKGGGDEAGDADSQSGGLFSGPGGALRNNTRRGRPAPTSAASDVVDAKAFSKQGTGSSETDNKAAPAPAVTSPVSVSSAVRAAGGFDDDAWDVKPSTRQPAAEPAAVPAAAAAPPTAGPAASQQAAPAAATRPSAALTGSMQELSLLTQPLQPEKTAAPAPPPAQGPAPLQVSQQPPLQQQQGATPSFFTGLSQPPPSMAGPANGIQPQQTGFARARPVAPQYSQGFGGLMPPPPPSRPLSAPLSAQPSAFTPPPLQPQMTGHIAPPGQSLHEMAQARMQQQFAQQMQQQAQQQQQQQQQMTAMQGFQPQPLMPYPAGMQQPGVQFGLMGGMNGPQQQMQQSPFADPGRPQQQFQPPVQIPQPTGFMQGPTGVFNPNLQQQQQQQQQQQFGGGGGGGVNAFLPPPLEPQRTGMTGPQPMLQPQMTGMTFNNQGFGQPPPAMAPLLPQKTGPAPPVRFGVNPDAKRLAPQPTGRKANLSAATPANPFGF